MSASSAVNEARMVAIDAALRDALAPEQIDIVDDSHLHAGHAGAADGAGHFTVTIVSTRFAGENAVARHRLVYAALGDMMGPEIHALKIEAFAPDEI